MEGINGYSKLKDKATEDEWSKLTAHAQTYRNIMEMARNSLIERGNKGREEDLSLLKHDLLQIHSLINTLIHIMELGMGLGFNLFTPWLEH